MTMPQAGYQWTDFKSFYTNEAILRLAMESRWTISANLDEKSKGKAPIDVKELFYGTGKIRGAFEINETCLMTLPQLCEAAPTATNNAFHLLAQTDGFMVLDIEPTCPAHIRDQLLQLPSLYTEFSMSGRGFHLVMPMPKNFDQFPIAANKQKLQEEHRWYEILIDHWVTFTRKTVPQEIIASLSASHIKTELHTVEPGDGMKNEAGASVPHAITDDGADQEFTWESLYASLASIAVESSRSEFELDTEMPELPFEDIILELMTRKPYKKSVEDFHGDYSKWEFGYLGYLYNIEQNVLRVTKIARAREWSESDKSWLLYRAAVEMLPHRTKHDEIRQGLPFLLYTANTLVARRAAQR